MDNPLGSNPKFPALVIERKSGNESFISDGESLSLKLDEFWKWAVSDLTSNTMRGVLAEFIVASAFGEVYGVRREWDAYDLKLPDGTKIEVKSTAYCQSWAQQDYSRPEFKINPTKGWDAETNISSIESKRQADIYVFCLLKEKDRLKVNPLCFDQWEFYLIGATTLNELFPHQKKIGLNRLLGKESNLKAVRYRDLANQIIALANRLNQKTIFTES